MNQFPRHYGTCPEMQFSQTLLALDGCILFWWMRYLLRRSVFLHCRQEKLLFKIYLSMIGKHKTLHGFKFQVAGHHQKYQGIKARRHWVLIAGQRSPLLSLPPGALNSWVIILKTALMETHVGDECQRLHWAGISGFACFPSWSMIIWESLCLPSVSGFLSLIDVLMTVLGDKI